MVDSNAKRVHNFDVVGTENRRRAYIFILQPKSCLQLHTTKFNETVPFCELTECFDDEIFGGMKNNPRLEPNADVRVNAPISVH